VVLGLLVVFIRASKLREAQYQNDPRKENIAESPERTHGFERHEVEWGRKAGTILPIGREW